jgi:hypothetical protein
MNINIIVPDQVEAALRRKAATFGQNLGEYLQRLVVEEAEEELPLPPQGESTETFMVRLRAIVQRHGVGCGHVNDSRLIRRC